MAATGAVERKRKINEEGAMDTSETLPGKRNRTIGDAAESSKELRDNQETRSRAGDPHLASVGNNEVFEEARPIVAF